MSATLKILSVKQPWATLIVTGHKKLETRSWSTEYRGQILIHASKKMDREQKKLVEEKHFKTALKDIEELPLGVILGVVSLTGITSTDSIFAMKDAGIPIVNGRGHSKVKKLKEWEKEIAFGNYSTGRHAWVLKDPVQFKTLIEHVGELSLKPFDYNICLKCGCMDHDCGGCIEKHGGPCSWVERYLCSGCA